MLRYALIFSTLNKYCTSLCFSFLHQSWGGLIYQKVQVRYQLIHLLLKILIFLFFFCLSRSIKKIFAFSGNPWLEKLHLCIAEWLGWELRGVCLCYFFHIAIDFRLHCKPRRVHECCLYARKGMKISLWDIVTTETNILLCRYRTILCFSL